MSRGRHCGKRPSQPAGVAPSNARNHMSAITIIEGLLIRIIEGRMVA
jgi:hypothetical protein